MSSINAVMDWERSGVLHPAVKATEQKPEVSVPSTEGMPPLSDITKHKGKRRNRTGSLTAHYTVAECRERDNSVPKMPPLTRIRRPPITGRSWDDNSVGHGSVVSRIRRDRNRAILRTQSSVTNPLGYHSIDTQANVTSTLNLINTTALSPLLSDSHHDNIEWLNNFWGSTPHQPSAAAKSSAGSMCNIPASGYQMGLGSQPWDTLSIPELHSTKSCDRTCQRSHHRHSYSSGYANTSHLHSSPTSGCASIASSDLDSADFMYFNINDDSSYFDGDSLFADSLGIIGDNDTAFSTNILSLLEEGSISCRTPFPASDWPDSISELDFDCSEGKAEDVKNCDALSDIGPSCSSPPQRRRMTKRQSMTQTKPNDCDDIDGDCDDQPSVKEVLPIESQSEECTEASTKMEEPLTPTESSSALGDNGLSALPHPLTEKMWLGFSLDEKTEYLTKLMSVIKTSLSSEEQFDVTQLLSPTVVSGTPHIGTISPKSVEYSGLQKALNYLQQRRRCLDSDWVLVKPTDQRNGTLKLIKQKKVLKSGAESQSPSNGGYLATQDLHKKMDFDDTESVGESLKPRNCELGTSKLSCHTDTKATATRDLIKLMPNRSKETSKKLIEIGRCFDDNLRSKTFRYSRNVTLDENGFRSHTRPGSRHETLSTKSSDAQHVDSCIDPSCQGCSSNLRRSNSEGNIAKSIGAEGQKEHRRQQRQARRRWSKWLKTRQRKENRQLIKEHRSGLFLNERKIKVTAGCGEDDEVEVG